MNCSRHNSEALRTRALAGMDAPALASWFSQGFRAIAPAVNVAAQVVGVATGNPEIGTIVATAGNALFPGSASGQNPSDRTYTTMPINAATIQPVAAPAATDGGEWIAGVSNGVVLAGAVVVGIGGLALLTRGGRK